MENMENMENKELTCFICLDNVHSVDTNFIKAFMGLPCKCGWNSHIKCYEEWAKTTETICPYCLLRDDYKYDDFEDDDEDNENNNIQVNNQLQHQLQPNNIAFLEIVNRNRLNMVFLIHTIDIGGFCALIIFIYCVIVYLHFLLIKKKVIIDYNDLYPMNFY